MGQGTMGSQLGYIRMSEPVENLCTPSDLEN